MRRPRATRPCPSSGRWRGEDLQRGADRGGVGVVAFVDQVDGAVEAGRVRARSRQRAPRPSGARQAASAMAARARSAPAPRPPASTPSAFIAKCRPGAPILNIAARRGAARVTAVAAVRRRRRPAAAPRSAPRCPKRRTRAPARAGRGGRDARSAGCRAAGCATPPGSSPSKISAFAKAMPVDRPKVPRWTARHGGDERHMRAGELRERRGSLRRGSCRSRSRRSGRQAACAPASAARPSGCCSSSQRRGWRPARRGRARSISLVEVLPTEPVTATTRACGAGAGMGAEGAPAPPSVSSTSRRGASSAAPRGCGRRRPRRPRPASACGRRSRGRRAASARATNRSPARCARLSMDDAASPRSGRSARASGGGPASRLVQSAGHPVPLSVGRVRRRRAPARHRRTDGRSSPTIWPVSWPLPAISRRSPGCEERIGLARIASARSADLLARSGAAFRIGGADRGGVLGAGVVVGDDDQVGGPRGLRPSAGACRGRGRRRRRRRRSGGPGRAGAARRAPSPARRAVWA